MPFPTIEINAAGRRQRKTLRIGQLALLTVNMLACAVFAQSASVAIDIPAQSLDKALTTFARQTGARIVFSTDLAERLTSPPVRGTLTTREALERLLAGSPLQPRETPDGGFAIVPRAEGSSKAGTEGGDVATLPTVKVTAGAIQESAFGPGEGYLARRSATATKTDTLLIETPQSISVVTSEQMQTQKANTLQEALAYSSGLASGVVGMNPAVSDSFFIRGFQADAQYGSFYRDGMKYMANIYNGQQETYGLERVEVLKGPSSVLYGAAAPGGVINTVSKRPQPIASREVNLELGRYGRRQLSADLTGPIDERGEWSYRLTALARKSDTFKDFGKDDRIYVAPALTWRPSKDTSLTLLASYQKTDASDPGTLPAIGTLLPNPNGVIPVNRYLGEPTDNNFDTQTRTFSYLFEHAFSDAVTLRHGLRQYNSDLDYRYFLMSGYVNGTNQRLLGRQARWFADSTSILTSDSHLQFKFGEDKVQHTVLAGIDYSRSRHASDRERGSLASIDVFNPTYGAAFATTPWRQFRTNENKTGLYLQDQVKINRQWVLLVGGRYDRTRTESLALHDPGSDANETQSAFTGRAGLVYLADNGLAPYVSFSQSFEPTGGLDRFAQRLKPTKGTQYEVGIRYQPPGSRTLLSAAIYQLTRTNVTTPDPVDPSYQAQTGEVRSRGLELEARSKVGRHVELIAAYSYTDANITRSNIPAELGTRFYAAPLHVASAWIDYELAGIGLQGWVLGGGVRYVSQRPGSKSSNILGTPAYTLADLRVSYQRGPWRYAVNVSNVTDKRYIPSTCLNGVIGCDYGAPRGVILTASYRW
ncbi:TonB-dependent siderophore receptor [Ottowia thiooxydans]|uniref:TonB-dependent siderophore receptor n=1 Tax=Ottowia thiooxydans TaxID=219182 RepID=UPI00041C84AA|nr:TonB-dependent siderophore receptor [Ottowia thiooxydans]